MSLDRLKPALESGIPSCNWIVRFDAAGRAEAGSAIDLDRLGVRTSGYVWLHLDRADVRILEVLKGIPTLTSEARDALGGTVDHQFVEHVDEIVCGAVVDHQHGIDGPSDDTDFLRFACGPGYLITARRLPLYSARATRYALAAGAIASTPISLFEMMVTHLCDCSARMTREIAATLDKIEDNVVLEGRGRDQRAGLGYARRRAVRLARQVNGLQSTLRRLEEATESPDHQELEEVATSLGQRADSLARDVANLQDRARMLQDEINAILTLETNDRLYMLTVITALILPATFVTGYFGMNTKQLPFAESDNGSLYATILCVAAAGVALLVLRRLGLTEQTADRRVRDERKAGKPVR
jgi:zinc transporter